MANPNSTSLLGTPATLPAVVKPGDAPAVNAPLVETPVPQSAGPTHDGQITTQAVGDTSKESTMAFIDPLHAETEILPDHSNRDMETSVGIEDMTTRNLLNRGVLIWSGSVPFDDTTWRIERQLPHAIFDATAFAAKRAVEIHEYFATKRIEIKVVSAASPWAFGAIYAAWYPQVTLYQNWMNDSTSTDTINTDQTPANMIDTNMMILNLGTGNSATIEVPATTCLSVLRPPIKPQKWESKNIDLNWEWEDFNWYGTIVFGIWNKLDGGSGLPGAAVNPVDISIYARLVDPELRLFRAPRPIVAPAETEGIIAAGAAAVGGAIAAGAAAAAPAVGSAVMAGTAGIITAGAGAAITAIQGHECTTFQHLTDDMVSLNLVTTNDKRFVDSLGYTPEDFVTSKIDTEELPTEVSIRAWAAKRSRVAIFKWPVSAESNAPLWNTTVEPWMEHFVESNIGDTVIVPSNLMYSSLLFSYWRGSITVTFEVQSNSFQRGTLGFALLPSNSAVPTSWTEAQAFPSALLNTAETRKVSLRVPYNNTTDWSLLPNYKETGPNAYTIKPGDNIGVLCVYCVNRIQLTYPLEIDGFEVNVYVHSDDMDYRIPNLRRNFSPSLWTQQDVGETEGAVDDIEIPSVEIFPSGSQAHPSHLMPNSHTDIGQLLTKRQNVKNLVLKPNVYTKVTMPVPPVTYGESDLTPAKHWAVMNYYAWIANCHAFTTGGHVVSIMSMAPTDENQSFMLRITYPTQPEWEERFSRILDVSSSSLEEFISAPFSENCHIHNRVIMPKTEIHIPYYSKLRMLPSKINCANTQMTLDQQTIAAFVPNAMLEIFIPPSKSETHWALTHNIGPDFALGQFLGAPRVCLAGTQAIPPPPGPTSAVRHVKVNSKILGSRNVNLEPPSEPDETDAVLREIDEIFSKPILKNTLDRVDGLPDVKPARKLKHLKFSEDNLVIGETEGSSGRITVRTNVKSCWLCDCQPKGWVALVNHVISSHPAEAKEVPLTCYYCKQAGILGDWKAHNKHCDVFNPKKCPTCEQPCNNLEKLLAHVTTSHAADDEAREKIIDIYTQKGYRRDTIGETEGVWADWLKDTTQDFLGISDITEKLSHVGDNVNAGVAHHTDAADKAKAAFASITKVFDKIGSKIDGASAQSPHFSPERATLSVAAALREQSIIPLLEDLLVTFLGMVPKVWFTAVNVILKPWIKKIASERIVRLLDTYMAVSTIDSIIGAIGWTEGFGGENILRDVITVVCIAFAGILKLRKPIELQSFFTGAFNLVNIGRTSMSIDTILSALFNVTAFVKSWITGDVQSHTGLAWFRKNEAKIVAWSDKALSFKEKLFGEIQDSPDLRQQVGAAALFARDIISNSMLIEKSNTRVHQLRQLAQEVRTMGVDLLSSAPAGGRVRPTPIVLHGTPQCGKTHLLTHIIPRALEKTMGWEECALYEQPKATTPNEKVHHDAYYGQQMWTINDAASDPELSTMKGFLNMIGSEPYPLSCAHLELKANQFYSVVVGATTNSYHPNFKRIATNPSAYSERWFENHFTMRVKPRFQKPNGALNNEYLKEKGITNPDMYADFYEATFDLSTNTANPNGYDNHSDFSEQSSITFAEIMGRISHQVKSSIKFRDSVAVEDYDWMDSTLDVDEENAAFTDAPLSDGGETYYEDCYSGAGVSLIGSANRLKEHLGHTEAWYDKADHKIIKARDRWRRYCIGDIKMSDDQFEEDCAYLSYNRYFDHTMTQAMFSLGVGRYCKLSGKPAPMLYHFEDLENPREFQKTWLEDRGSQTREKFYDVHCWYRRWFKRASTWSGNLIKKIFDTIYDYACRFHQWGLNGNTVRDCILTWSKYYIVGLVISYGGEFLLDPFGNFKKAKMEKEAKQWAGLLANHAHVASLPGVQGVVDMPSAEKLSETAGRAPPDPEQMKATIEKIKMDQEKWLIDFQEVATNSAYNSDPVAAKKPSVLGKISRPKARVGNAIGHTNSMQDMEEFSNLLEKNAGEIHAVTTGSRLKFLGIGGHLILTNAHLLDGVVPDTLLELHRNGMRYTIPYNENRVVRWELDDGRRYDAVLIYTGWGVPEFRDIKKHFFREEDMYRVAGLDGFRYTTSNGMGHTTTLNKLEINHGQLINDKNSGIKNYPISITAKGVEARGYCGSPWIANNLGSRLHCIVGIHAWCVSQSMIGATPVTQEMLEEGVTQLAHLEITTRKPTIPTIGNTECISMTYNEHGRVAPEYAYFTPGKHDFKATPWMGEFADVTAQPAVLNKYDRRLDEEVRDTFEESLILKNDRANTWFEDNRIPRESMLAVSDELNALDSPIPGRLLTWDEVTNGFDNLGSWGTELGLEMRNSAGYVKSWLPPDFIVEGKGKYPYFHEREQPLGERRKFDPVQEVLSRVRAREEAASRREVIENSIWLDVRKAELRKNQKIYSGKTRIVNAPPLDLMMLTGKYFGAFRAFLMAPGVAGLNSESILGIDHVKVWPELGINLKEAFALFGIDFTAYDASKPGELEKLCVDLINRWYEHQNPGYSREEIKQHNTVREVLWYEFCHATHLFGDFLYQVFCGWASGVPAGMTTGGNILSNKILSRIVFMIITHLHASLFRKHCGAIYMGDDNTQWIHDISDRVVLNYNRQAYAEVLSQVGMTVTNPDKSDELTPFDSFEDITFLKQGFSDVVRVGCFLPTMSLETVGNLTNWYRKGGGPQQPIENLKICLEFLAPYGQETFNEFRSACLENDKVRLYEPDLPTFWRTIYGRFLSDENIAGKLSLPSLSEHGSNPSNLTDFQS